MSFKNGKLIDCVVCKKQVYVSKSKVRRKYCSHACYWKVVGEIAKKRWVEDKKYRKKMTRLSRSFRHTAETKKHQSKIKVGEKNPMYGKTSWNKGMKFPERSGENHPNWIKDRTKVKRYYLERQDAEYKQWVIAIKKRDNNSCRIEDSKCSGHKIAHHIKGWTKYKKLRYVISNGIILCVFHHKLVHQETWKTYHI